MFSKKAGKYTHNFLVPSKNITFARLKNELKMSFKAISLYLLIIVLLPFTDARAQLAYDSTPLSIPTHIMGQGQMTARQLCIFFITYAADTNKERISRMANLYIDEAKAEGVNHDIAFAQMVLETGWLQFNGVVTPQMNNFCGLGAISAEKNGLSFPDERTGIRAHIQHLKAYASKIPLSGNMVDPRYNYVEPKGKAPTIDGLTGTWAQDPYYSAKLKSLLQRMYKTSQ